MKIQSKKYTKKPVEIDAIEFNGTNWYECQCFIANDKMITIVDEIKPFMNELHISTLEGVMTASVGDYIIRGIEGEYYPCKPQIFKDSYDLSE